MCGIGGYTHLNRPPAANTIKAVIDVLDHRGPDEQTTYTGHHCSLAAARLSIIDVLNGHQPMCSDTGDAVLVFNGEVYNYRELRDELENLGHKFRTHSDTEVVLHAFLEWDTESFSRLRGMFAIAVWQENRKRLVLARDRLGIKPLYVCEKDNDIYFGSEIKAILVHRGIERRLSPEGLNLFLTMNYIPGELTLLQGIRKIRPGTWLEWRAGTIRQEEFWTLRVEPNHKWSLETAADALDPMLRESVREHLISDVPVGLWLSGGLDSSTILHYAAEESSQPVQTFSVTFQGKSFDETRFIRQMAERYGTRHHEIDVNPSLELASVIEELAHYSDEPSMDSGALPVWFLSRLTGSRVRVALSGEGGDELFGGYSTYLADILAKRLSRVPLPLLKVARNMARLWPISDNNKASFEYCVKRLLDGCRLPPDEAHVYWNGTFSSSEREAFFPETSDAPLRALLGSLHSRPTNLDALSPFFEYDNRYYLADDILCKTDRMSMAHSVEVRPPFLDHRIVEFSASLPDRLKIHGFNQKRVLKEVMKGKLPPSIIKRKKIGFDIPTHEWFRGALRPLLQDTLNATTVQTTGIFRWEPIRELIQAHLDRQINVGFHLWGLVNLFLWMRHWNVNDIAVEEKGDLCLRAAATC
jgi:asparagine synthase (glutamine-hydrolysing)